MPAPATILVVEDEQGVRDLLTAVLRHAGHNVVVAPTGALGIRFAQTHLPQVVLLDVHLPDLDGFSVARRILEACPTRVVMLTGDADEQSKLRGRAAGAHDYLTKPVTPKALLAVVGLALSAPVGPSGGSPPGSPPTSA